MSRQFRVEGGKELAEALRELGKSTGKNVLRRVGRKRLEPMRDSARAKAPKDTGALEKAIIIGTRLARSQRAARGVHVGGGAMRADAKNGVTLYMGPGQQPQAITQEFGTYKEPAQPYMRPAFDAEANSTVDGIGVDLWAEIRKTAARAAKRAAKRAAGGG